MTLGGMRMPRVPPAQMTPHASDTLYFRFSMAGRAISPTVVSVAPTTPAVAAKRVHNKMVQMARPPLIPPSTRYIALNSFSAAPDLVSTAPMKINSGTAGSTSLAMTPP
jgi:hypothetical protein